MNKKWMVMTAFVFGALVCSSYAKIVFEDADTNGDGFLTKEEYIAAHKADNPAKDEAKVLEWFASIDKDGDGMISEQEFKVRK